MIISKYLFLATGLWQTAEADWQYLSRPDLSPPKLNITVPATSSVNPGYIFVAPYHGFDQGSAGPAQPGAYIFRDDGDLVWSSVGYLAGWVADFGPTVIDGSPVLRAFQGLLDETHGRMYGDHAVLDDHYDTVQIVRTASHRLASCHEFNVVNNGTSVLIETPVSIPADLREYGGDEEQRWILTNGFQELDIDSGELLFEWYSFDHISPKNSAFPLEQNGPFNGRTAANAWNYFHINSVEKDEEGNYLISARNYDAIFKINGTDGAVIWQLGGHHGSDFEIPVNAKFAYQHDARFQHRTPDGSIERISFFDNADHSVSNRSISAFSRARYIELNHTAGTVTELHTYPAPDNLLAKSQGNTQFLPNGNVFVNWGEAGAVTEFAKEGQVLFHAYLDSEPYRNVQSYRGFRSNWTGLSSEEPAVLALKDSIGDISIYVSWNGDTETAFWQFYLENNVNNVLTFIGKKRKAGFETLFEIKPKWQIEEDCFVHAESVDSQGRVLGQSRPIRIKDSSPYQEHLADNQPSGGSTLKHSQERLGL